MVLGYLINVYPGPTHSFIRREIAAVESLGHVVRRFTIRPGVAVVDSADLAEAGRTAVLLEAGATRFAGAFAAALGRPQAFLGALRLAIQSGLRSPRGVLRYLAYFAEACLLLRWCRRDGVEHLHAHFGSNPAAVAMLCHALGGPSYSFTAHGIETFDAPEFMALDEKIARAAFTVGVSQFGRSQLCRWSHPAHWERIHVVRCGVDRQILGRPLVTVPGTRRLVCVARLSREKGHVSLLHAARRLHQASVTFELVLVGDGPLRGQLEALAGGLGIGPQVRFAGWLDGAGVIRELQSSRALVLPSFSEGLPVVLMEALALGRPCIATQITGIPELVQPGVTGWLVPASSEEALAAAMAEALDASPIDLDRMGRAGAERVARLHDANVEAARMVALFVEAIRGTQTAMALPGPRHGGAPAPGLVRASSGAVRWLGAGIWRASGKIGRNRMALYGGAVGLRIAVFHGTPAGTLDHMKRVVGWWRERWPLATPDDVDDLVGGRCHDGPRDSLLLTFDDGLASNYDAAVWLARAGIRAVFFVIPSLLDRTIAEFVRYHEERGVTAFPPVLDGRLRGLSTSQLREMLSMGHRIGAHNNAHRDLGHLHLPGDLRYEIGDAMASVGELTGVPCRDFAIGFGQPENLSLEAADFLRQTCQNVYMCHRGLNVPGLTPRFLLRHAHDPLHPLAFTQVCLEGGADHRLVGRVREVGSRVGLLPRGSVAPPGLALAAGSSTPSAS